LLPAGSVAAALKPTVTAAACMFESGAAFEYDGGAPAASLAGTPPTGDCWLPAAFLDFAAAVSLLTSIA
jgi:hypothetical protein